METIVATKTVPFARRKHGSFSGWYSAILVKFDKVCLEKTLETSEAGNFLEIRNRE